MTELQKLYLKARANTGLGHYAAMRDVAEATGLDAGTVDRCLKRAQAADAQDARRAR